MTPPPSHFEVMRALRGPKRMVAMTIPIEEAVPGYRGFREQIHVDGDVVEYMAIHLFNAGLDAAAEEAKKPLEGACEAEPIKRLRADICEAILKRKL